MKYFIAQGDIDWSDNRFFNKGGTGIKPKRKNGYIGLFNRNTKRFIWFKILEKSIERFGYIVYRNKKVNSYWNNLEIIKN